MFYPKPPGEDGETREILCIAGQKGGKKSTFRKAEGNIKGIKEMKHAARTHSLLYLLTSSTVVLEAIKSLGPLSPIYENRERDKPVSSLCAMSERKPRKPAGNLLRPSSWIYSCSQLHGVDFCAQQIVSIRMKLKC